jgi:ATP-dependent Clp protease protease subunit
LANNTGRTLDQIEKDSDRDKYMTAEEAKKYGLVDEIYKVKKSK